MKMSRRPDGGPMPRRELRCKLAKIGQEILILKGEFVGFEHNQRWTGRRSWKILG